MQSHAEHGLLSPHQSRVTLMFLCVLLVAMRCECLSGGENLSAVPDSARVAPDGDATGQMGEKNQDVHGTLNAAPSQEVRLVPWSEFTWAGSPRCTMDGAQPNLSTQIRPIPAATVGGLYFGSLTWLHFYQKRTIWAAGSSFRIADNYDESLSANYGGHFTGGYFLSYLSTEMLLTSGFGLKMATICGTLMGFAYQFYVEALDGYGKDYGFSPYEFYWQTLGTIYYYASYSWPALQDFVPKTDYYPASSFGQKQKYLSKTPIDDYSAWTFWMSANVHHLLPSATQRYYPDWLNLAVGYSARNLGYPDRFRVLVFALDFNLAKILPKGGAVWNWWRQTLVFLKIPGPALEIQMPGQKRLYLLYPFKVQL